MGLFFTKKKSSVSIQSVSSYVVQGKFNRKRNSLSHQWSTKTIRIVNMHIGEKWPIATMHISWELLKSGGHRDQPKFLKIYSLR